MEGLILAAALLPAFIWLGYETNWMTVRLLVGEFEQAIILEYKTWQEVEISLNRLPVKYQPFWHKFPKNMTPLCGMNWLKNNSHVVPISKVELYFGNGYKQTFTLKKPELIKEIVKINTGKKYFKKLALAN